MPTPNIESNRSQLTEIERFVDSLPPSGRERLETALDDQVHDEKSAEAARINNAGILEQEQYLGLTRTNLLAMLDRVED